MHSRRHAPWQIPTRLPNLRPLRKESDSPAREQRQGIAQGFRGVAADQQSVGSAARPVVQTRDSARRWAFFASRPARSRRVSLRA
jgi:hypothetical protein